MRSYLEVLSESATNTAIANAIAALVDSSPSSLDTLNELAAALGDDPNFATTIINALGQKANLASPEFIGDPILPAATTIGNVTPAEIARLSGVTSNIQTQLDSKTGLNSPNFTGTPSLPSGSLYDGVSIGTSGSGTFSETITWTGTTAPSGTATHAFMWRRVLKQIFVLIRMKWSTAGSALTAMEFPLPSGFPSLGTLSSIVSNLGNSEIFLPMNANVGVSTTPLRGQSGDTSAITEARIQTDSLGVPICRISFSSRAVSGVAFAGWIPCA